MPRFEWAHVAYGFRIVSPEELAELAPDGNDEGEYGIHVGDEVMLYGRRDDLVEFADQLRAEITGVPAAKREEIRVRYEVHSEDLRSRGEITLPPWCSGDPRSAVALYFFGDAGARHLITSAVVVD